MPRVGAHEIQRGRRAATFRDLLPLMRGYCEFYEVAPSDDDLLAMARVLIADPEREGLQLLARDADGRRDRLRHRSSGPGRR